MNRSPSCFITTAIALGLSIAVVAPASAQNNGRQAQKKHVTPNQLHCASFSELWLTLEQNYTDGDTEVVLFAKGQDEGLKGLAITGPHGREIALIGANPHGIGLREFLLESAEPPDIDRVLASFPEGSYRFNGKTVSGRCLRGSAELSHDLAPATSLLSPGVEDVVPIDNLMLSWEAVPDATSYIIELNNENNGAEMTFTVFPPTTSLSVPASMLTADSEYQFGVGVRTENGNLTTVELVFFTAP